MEQVDEGRVRILVVEDNPLDVELLRMALDSAQLQYELTVIEDGAEALDLIREQANLPNGFPDLAVLDLNLPKNDGLEVLKALRACGNLRKVPVAIMSSSSSARDRGKLEEFGVGRYITKPSDLDEFLRIGNILKELLAESKSQGKSSGA